MRVKRSGIASAGLLWCALVLAVTAQVAASDTSAQVRSDTTWLASAPILAEPVFVQVAVGSGPSSEPVREARNISLDFHAADIADVLKALSLQSGTNIVTGTDVKGPITVSLNKVSLREALDMVTKLSNYRYAMVGRETYIVGTAQSVDSTLGVAPEQAVTETVRLALADPEQIKSMVETQFPGVKATPSGAKAGEPGPKLVVIAGNDDVVRSAVQLVQNVDRALVAEAAGKQVDVVKLRYVSAKDVTTMLTAVLPRLAVTVGPTTSFTDRPPAGVTFATSGGTGGGGGGGAAGGYGGGQAQQPKEEPQTVILSGTPEDVAKAREIIAALDGKPKQVLIEAKVTDITVGAQKRLGITWSWTSFTFSEGSEASGAGDGAFKRLPLTIEAQLDAMLKDNSVNLLANPTIAAIEGKPATIFIGDEIKYIIQVQQALTGTTYQTETANVGVTLRVVARPTDDGYITLALHPEVSVISEFLRIGTGTGGNNATSAILLPQIARRFTDHVIRVKNGQMIAIGGLIRDQEINTLTRVPFLGDLPFFGSLFRHREKSKEHSEIAIFLKASILPDDES